MGGVLAGCASTSPSSTEAVNVSGRWSGVCYNCQATGFTLDLVQRGTDVTGTVVAAGRHAFGDAPRPVLNGKVTGRQFSFQAKGDPGDVWTVDTEATADGKTLSGTGNYRGSFGLKFNRIAP
jgi:hypothetical protein